MRNLLILFLASLICFACVKAKTENVVPVLAYIDFEKAGKSPYSNQDTAVLKFSFEDGDGDLFRDQKTDPSNIVVIPSYFYPDSNKFSKGLTFSYVLVQPENGYYKNKSITGDIELPLSQFRPSDAIKKIQFEFFMVDMKDNKSNVVTTPTIVLNF